MLYPLVLSILKKKKKIGYLDNFKKLAQYKLHISVNDINHLVTCLSPYKNCKTC